MTSTAAVSGHIPFLLPFRCALSTLSLADCIE